jgi:nucleoside-diphosphate-sugar epimerase
VAELLARGTIVRCLVRRADAAMRLLDTMMALGRGNPGRLELVFGSLRDEPVDRSWLTECDAIVHAAGALRGAPSVLVRENVVATRALTDAAVNCRIRRFVLVSSLSVYASPSRPSCSVIDESSPVEPAPARRGAYVYSKVVQEAVCRDACRDRALPLVVIRPGVIFGPGRTFLSDRVGLHLGRLLALVDPDRLLPYTYVANCASAVAAAVLTNSLERETFNIVDDELPTARQLVEAFQQCGGDLRVLRVPGWAATSLSRLYGHWHARTHRQLPSAFLPFVIKSLYTPIAVSNAKAKARLQWQPRVDLQTALRMTMAREDAIISCA